MFDLRSLTLGPAFNPKVEDIPTPELFTAQGVPPDLLRLVSLSASERIALIGGFGDDSALNSALLICATLCYRDQGGPQGLGKPVYAMTDAPAFVKQDFSLLDALGKQVKTFLGLGDAPAIVVEAAKNDLEVAPSSTGGTDTPTTAASPSESANP
jgi:hypothetical protein